MDNDMLTDFSIEAEELFDEAEESLLSIEKSDDYQGCFNSIFRAFHSVKGAAGMFGLERLQEHMHFVENLLETKKELEVMSQEMVDYLLSSVDCVRQILKGEDPGFDYFDPDSKGEENQTLDKTIIDSMRSVLEGENFKVTTFDNAHDTINTLKDSSPDLVITDINMPEMNGIEFMRKVNSFKPFLPFLVVSGFVTKSVCMDALACGVSGIVEKPFDGEQLVSMTRLFVSRYQNMKLLNKSIDLLVYQFEEFDKYLFEKFGENKRDAFRHELKNLLKQKNDLLANIK